MNKAYHLRQLLEGQQVSLPALLDQKEQRARRQEALLAQGGSLISFTMNIVGPVKTAPVLSLAFEEGRRRIFRQLQWHEIPILSQEHRIAPGGEELYVLVDAPAEAVKAHMAAVEDGFPMGRLFDIDVRSREKGILSRETPRRCLLCGERAVLCARGRTHSREDLLKETVRLICDYFNGQYADAIAGLCCRALLYEVAVTPKPGLVDRWGSGAHRDMDLFTFLDSVSVLTPYFRDCVLRGIEGSQLPPSDLFQTLRDPGRQAEEIMRQATGGVNTHKGAIFSLGILCAALGRLFDRETGDVFDLCREMCAGLTQEERDDKTNGDRVYRRYGAGGARAEAAAGFPSVRNIGLPALRAYLDRGKDVNDAGMLTLLHLMAQVEDTNMLHRAGREDVDRLQKRLRDLLRRGKVTPEDVILLDRELTAQNISPGGCADLLALSYFLWLVEGYESSRGECPVAQGEAVEPS